ncbi:linear amide C-N hydrolase, choloylglycine hydrolase family protein (macronuclear) [Tetrahymena thermophila SB210]|uniref:Acid ceramidase n=1 Tax=Tetrahymena thermophila (strain SB210) TaxID=312017 RepID=Q24DP9_TETTS|nr:linear amide C-N hydrolase, choloylglycine hydrolase family protein [Tetrahymena thermophila SB210]EAS05941.1 linear amide C-N hydrolase, choloylglycine hydrolase family protein [Tetrahymena thermophila SB210]|eukprot:XP_001026186.1 linear amide C-N hydrolase, choloylglycine hydrolase family protein [Tetrahymena thermophila SB210]
MITNFKTIFLLILAFISAIALQPSYCVYNGEKPLQCANYTSLAQTSGASLPKYVVNLDLSYQDRWREIITNYKSAIQGFETRIEQLPKAVALESQLPFYKDPDFMGEVQAIATLAGVKFETLQLLSQMYEALDSIGCTSIVARHSDGSIYHARNLDYSFVKYISPLLANIDFQRGGKTVFIADMVIGTAIVVTGIVPNGFSITINQRQDDGQAISYLQKQYIPACYLIYKILQTKTTYSDALDSLMNTKIAMPAYFIIAGLSGNQGTVIERDREAVHLQTTLSGSTWFICQTNFDRSQPDDPSDYRRVPCEQKMGLLNQNSWKPQDIFNILSSSPNFIQTTIATDVMNPNTGYINSTRWFNPPSTTQTELSSYQQILSIGIIILTIFLN